MAKRLEYNIYLTNNIAKFIEAMIDVSNQLNVELNLNAKPESFEYDLRMKGTQSTICLHYTAFHENSDTWFYELGKRLNIPWLTTRIQESNHWDYSLFDGSDWIDQFSTDPHYFNESKKSCPGNSKLLANKWNISVKDINQYIKRWGLFKYGRAYKSDQYKYGDYNQIYDFMKTIGAEEPVHPSHSINFKNTGFMNPINIQHPYLKPIEISRDEFMDMMKRKK